MGIILNPLLFSGLQKTSSGGVGIVDAVVDLPVSAVDGTLKVVKDTNSIYMYDAGTSSWVLITDPLTDLRQLSSTVSESATFADIPLFVFDASVQGFSAIIDVEKNSTLKETIAIQASKTSTVPQRSEQAIGDITTLETNVIEDGFGQLQVQYKTDAAAASYKITFRAITLT